MSGPANESHDDGERQRQGDGEGGGSLELECREHHVTGAQRAGDRTHRVPGEDSAAGRGRIPGMARQNSDRERKGGADRHRAREHRCAAQNRVDGE